MESGADKYLHKKFKKQLSVEPKHHQQQQQNVEVKKEILPATSTVTTATSPPHRNNGATSEPLVLTPTFPFTRDASDRVPNISTNYRISSATVLVDSSSISTIATTTAATTTNVISVKLEPETNEWRNGEPTIITNCISQCIASTSATSTSPSSSFLAKYNSFDTKTEFSNNQQAINLVASSAGEKSSIFDNNVVYSASATTCSGVEQPQTPTVLEESAAKNAADAAQSGDKKSEGKYVCAYCNLACSKPSVLQKHIRAHTNERPYPCVSCGFSFKTRSNLYKHCRSRTHANRVMGNKMQEAGPDFGDQDKADYADQNSPENLLEDPGVRIDMTAKKSPSEVAPAEHELNRSSKPYKPRFHTAAKAFYESVTKENIAENVALENKRNLEAGQQSKQHAANPDLLSHHINELINKNNSIVNSTDPYLQKKRSLDNGIVENNNEYVRYNENAFTQQPSVVVVDAKPVDEPLNLSRNRKRCMSEADHSTNNKSLIKELLLKSLYADSNLQCPYCKMLFQSVPELELHKMRNCKGQVKTGARYSRSSSVNVASILTQNKNAFDNIPQFYNFPLKSPGPFLGKTRLIESDKCAKSFSFDDISTANLAPSSPVSPYGPSDLMKAKRNYAISPLTLQSIDKGVAKKSPVKLFGGEVKITQTSGETRSFKIENKETTDQFTDEGFVEYGTKISENRVIKSSLQSGGTVLQSKPTKPEKSPDVIRVYETSSIYSPNIDIMLSSSDDKSRFNFRTEISHNQPRESYAAAATVASAKYSADADVNREREDMGKPNMYKYTNIMDFSQKAVKLLAPNLKQPNLSVPGIPAPNTLYLKELPTPPAQQQEVIVKNHAVKMQENDRRVLESFHFGAQKQPKLEKMMETALASPQTPNPIYNPMNLLVNGQVVRHVPGMPGPVAAESPMETTYQPAPNIISVGRPAPISKPPNLRISIDPTARPAPMSPSHVERDRDRELKFKIKSKLSETNISEPLEIKTAAFETAVPLKINEQKSPNSLLLSSLPPSTTTSSFTVSTPSGGEMRKFARPNSLALKPSMSSVKQHHGLTPTMFNQALISPDTPRVAKKYNQHFINGNYFSCLGLKSSTKPVYCTLNKTQPFYVTHFKKLSMYSEWRQQDNKPDKLYVSNYDSRQRQSKYTMAGKTSADLIVHSSYKFVMVESSSTKEDDKSRTNSVLGGYESNEDYTYIRGRGRGRYVCDQCGIRCKKPSMLKKHIRTHSDDRPYTCLHCNFSFKTKGNLTKHMKSKTHEKKYAATSCSSSQPSGTPSSGSASDSDDSDMDSCSDESTRLQEHEAAHCLLSLSQKNTQNIGSSCSSQNDGYSASVVNLSYTQPASESSNHSLNHEDLLHDHKSNIILQRNKSPYDQNHLDCNASRASSETSSETQDSNFKMVQFLGKSSSVRPLTYPYQQIEVKLKSSSNLVVPPPPPPQMVVAEEVKPLDSPSLKVFSPTLQQSSRSNVYSGIPLMNVPEKVISEVRKRKLSTASTENVFKFKINKSETAEVMDLSMPSSHEQVALNLTENGYVNDDSSMRIYHNQYHNVVIKDSRYFDPQIKTNHHVENTQVNYINSFEDKRVSNDSKIRIAFNVINHENSNNSMESMENSSSPPPLSSGYCAESSDGMKPMDGEHDNSAMQFLAEIATKQVKLERNTMAKNVASEYVKLTTKSEYNDASGSESVKSYMSTSKETSGELIVKPEENKNCSICSKSFSKPSQLRLHMNIHYLERPFRCDSCSISFRTKGHLQKHERSASHNNKLSSSPALSSSEPRPFKCSDCNIAFRIHGHLAKHLRSKMHIMKLECLAKIPFGLYAELERANSLLTEINTADGDQCLESLRALARKLFMNDGGKMNNHMESIETVDVDS